MKKILLKNWKIKYATAVIVTLMLVLSLANRWFDSLDQRFSDRVFQKASSTDMPIYIIGIEEKTLEAYGSYSDWGRKYYAQLVEVLNSSPNKPAVIGFDILFTGAKDEEGDAAFAKAISESDNVILASSLLYSTKVTKNETSNAIDVDRLNIDSIVYPYKPFYEGALNVGFSNNDPETDGFVRCMFTTRKLDDGSYMDSLALSVYKAYCDKVGIDYPDYSQYDRVKRGFRYTAGPEGYDVYPLVDVLEGRVSIQEKNAIVLVGGYATGFEDYFHVPISDKKLKSSDKMHGVEIHANIIEAIDEEAFYVPVANKTAEIAIYAVLLFLLAIVIGSLEMLPAGIVSLVTVIIQFVVYKVAFGKGVYIRFLVFAILMVVVYIVQIVSHYLAERREKGKIANAFKKYVAPQIVDEVAKKGGYELKLGGEKKHIAVLFVDIRGFTPMSESLQPEQVVEILNEYLALTTSSIFKNGGTLDKFIGDATMAVFNSPFDLDDYVFRAVCTAWDIAAGSKHIEEMFMARFGRTVSYGIGVNCGEAVIGNIGCDFRMDYTAIGDTVNTAARLEANAKAGQILISEFVYEIVKDRIDVSPIGEIPLKGKSKGVFVYQVTNIYRDGAVKPASGESE